MREQILLVVEDDQDIRYILRTWIESEFPEISVVDSSSLKDAILIAHTQNPRIVILDLNLPDSDGIDTVRSFRRYVPNPYIIVITGHDDDRTAREAIRSGADDFFAKPMEKERMVERLKIALARSEVELYHAGPIRETMQGMRALLSSPKVLLETGSNH